MWFILDIGQSQSFYSIFGFVVFYYLGFLDLKQYLDLDITAAICPETIFKLKLNFSHIKPYVYDSSIFVCRP